MEIDVNAASDRRLGWTFHEEVDLGSVENPATAFHDPPEQAVAFGRNGRFAATYTDALDVHHVAVYRVDTDGSG